MPERPGTPCSVPGCPELPSGWRCRAYEREANKDRASRGGAVYTSRRQRVRRALLYANPSCVLCGRSANIAGHFPESARVDLKGCPESGCGEASSTFVRCLS